MATYKIKAIDAKVVECLKNAVKNYNSCEKTNRASALSELSNAFSEVVKARSQAIDGAIPNSDLKHMTYVPDYKTIIIVTHGMLMRQFVPDEKIDFCQVIECEIEMQKELYYRKEKGDICVSKL